MKLVKYRRIDRYRIINSNSHYSMDIKQEIINYIEHLIKKNEIILKSHQFKYLRVDSRSIIRNFNLKLHKYLNKVFYYFKKFDIIEVEVINFKDCREENLISEQGNNEKKLKNVEKQLKILFLIAHLSLEILKTLNGICCNIPQKVSDKYIISKILIMAILEKIIISVKYDIRGMPESNIKKHYCYAFDSIGYLMHCL